MSDIPTLPSLQEFLANHLKGVNPSSDIGRCPICLEDMATDGGALIRTPCHHLLHQACLENWTGSTNGNRNRCSVCRRVLFQLNNLSNVQIEEQMADRAAYYEELLQSAAYSEEDSDGDTEYYIDIESPIEDDEGEGFVNLMEVDSVEESPIEDEEDEDSVEEMEADSDEEETSIEDEEDGDYVDEMEVDSEEESEDETPPLFSPTITPQEEEEVDQEEEEVDQEEESEDESPSLFSPILTPQDLTEPIEFPVHLAGSLVQRHPPPFDGTQTTGLFLPNRWVPSSELAADIEFLYDSGESSGDEMLPFGPEDD